MRLEKSLLQLEIFTEDENLFSFYSFSDSDNDYNNALKIANKKEKEIIYLTRTIEELSEDFLTKEKLKYTKWTNKRLQLVPIPAMSAMKSIRYYDLQFQLDEKLFCDDLESEKNHKLANVYDVSSFKIINTITYDVENKLYQVNIQEKKYCKELYQYFDAQKNYFCNWLRNLATNKAQKMIEVQNEIEKICTSKKLPNQEKLNLTNTFKSTTISDKEKLKTLKKSLFLENNIEEKYLKLVCPDELVDGFTNGQPYMTKLYKLEKSNTTVENVLIQEEYSSEFMKQVLQIEDDHAIIYDFQAKNGGFKAIFFDDMVSTLHKIYVQSDCEVLSLNDNNSFCSYTAISVKDGKSCHHNFKHYRKYWKDEGCFYCKHYIMASK